VTTAVAFDPGLRRLGVAVGSFSGARRKLDYTTTIETKIGDGSDLERMDLIVDQVLDVIQRFNPEVFGVEDYVWQSKERSANREFYRVSRVAHVIEGIARREAWSMRPRATRVFALPKNTINLALGLSGKVPKKRVMEAVARYFGAPFHMIQDEHQGDAAAMLWATMSRASHASQIQKLIGRSSSR